MSVSFLVFVVAVSSLLWVFVVHLPQSRRADEPTSRRVDMDLTTLLEALLKQQRPHDTEVIQRLDKLEQFLKQLDLKLPTQEKKECHVL